MAYTHRLTTNLVTPEGTVSDTGILYTATASWASQEVVNANGGGANAVAMAFPATDGTTGGVQSIGLLATVPCVVTFTGATVIDGVSTSTVTLTANKTRHIASITGAVTAISIGANTDSLGAAGTIQMNILYFS